jgi:hypothetical protein
MDRSKSNKRLIQYSTGLILDTPLVKDRHRLVLASEGAGYATTSPEETDLASCTLPAGLLSTFGGLKIRASGWWDGSAGKKPLNCISTAIVRWSSRLGPWHIGN